MHSKRALEGYLLIDNRASGGGMSEAPVLTCSHCHAQLIVNPLRTRERPWCRKCDHYLCDGCAAVASQTGECAPLNARFEEARDRAARAPLIL